MQRKAYVPGVAALIAALLAGCTGGGALGGEADDSKPGETGTTTAAAEPGKYRTLREPCSQVETGTLDSMLPGLREMTDEEQREKAYEGVPTVTYDTDRRVGCRWKVESSDATHHLLVDFERVVSYDTAVSDDTRATEVYSSKVQKAHLPEPSATVPVDDEQEEGSDTAEPSEDAASGADKSGKGDEKDSGKGAGDADDSASGGAPTGAATPPGLEPRALEDLGDEAFLDDALTTAASATRHRTVTVVFRTSNVIVTIEYDEQPGRRTDIPDSKEMQDKAQELAGTLADKFSE
ncbi:hypothetical protein GCM10010277_73150 [Streptomyces longisporoflavus]|uniref:DUF3558 domain-containing protein n=1 Tax=Streptomyces longisporoflavus TaxID=28044 RepID=UPI00167D38E8|nr:DUF3558 domain-containing protein [Streptomyces longisporoflavus]GGV65672.1 hypothetical protein GCM10010277_73150 [Streptomyces longisporoflavus]